MSFRFFLIMAGVMTAILVSISCQKSGSLELAWSLRGGTVGQWGIRGDEVFTVGRYLTVYNLTTGKELRRVKLPQDYGNTTLGEISPEIAITNSSLVFAWYDFKGEFKEKEGTIFSYDPNTLKLRWQRSLPLQKDVLELAPTFSVAIEGSYLYALAIGKEGENLFKLKLTDGETIWSTRIEKYIQGVPLVLRDGKLLIRSRVSPWSRDPYGYFQAINPETGETLWRVRIDGMSGVNDDPPIVSGDRAYLTSEGVLSKPDYFYTIDLSRGTIINHQRVYQLRAPFAEYRGVLYFAGNTPAAFDVSNGKILWQTDLRGPHGLGDPINASGVPNAAREEIYLGDWERNLYVLSSTTGQVKEKVNIRGYWRGDFLFSPLKAFFGSYGIKRLELNKGLLLVGTVDSSLFVFRPTNKK